jgi:hypothetical protein
MAADITWTGIGTWEALTNPEIVKKVLREQVSRANKKLAPKMIAKVRKDIREKHFKKNAILTEFLKGSSMPLVDQADLLNAVSARHKSAWEFHVGVIREDKAGNSIAFILHEGATRKVSEKMRAFFRAKAAETRGLVRPLKTSTTAIKIPARPFLKYSFVDDSEPVKVLVEWAWGDAIKQTFEIVGRRYKDKK